MVAWQILRVEQIDAWCVDADQLDAAAMEQVDESRIIGGEVAVEPFRIGNVPVANSKRSARTSRSINMTGMRCLGFASIRTT